MSTNQLIINLPKNWLPKSWVEVSRQGNENQITIKLGHINPENGANPLLTSGNPTAEVNGETVSVHGIAPRGTMTKFFDSMTKMAQEGWLKGYSPQKITELRGQFNQMQDEKYDATYYISVCQYPDETQAQQNLENQLALQTTGFSGMKLPDRTGKMVNYFDHEAIKQYLSPKQQTLMKEMAAKTGSDTQKKLAQEKFKYYLGSMYGYPAVLLETENPEYKKLLETKKRKLVPRDKNKFQGGGFDPLAGKGVLPKAPPATPPEKIITSSLVLRIGKYLINGNLLGAIGSLPKGSTYHESLTKTNTYIEKEKVEGQMYTTKHLIPVASTYATEGYIHREQAEKIIKTIIDSL